MFDRLREILGFPTQESIEKEKAFWKQQALIRLLRGARADRSIRKYAQRMELTHPENLLFETISEQTAEIQFRWSTIHDLNLLKSKGVLVTAKSAPPLEVSVTTETGWTKLADITHLPPKEKVEMLRSGSINLAEDDLEILAKPHTYHVEDQLQLAFRLASLTTDNRENLGADLSLSFRGQLQRLSDNRTIRILYL